MVYTKIRQVIYILAVAVAAFACSSDEISVTEELIEAKTAETEYDTVDIGHIMLSTVKATAYGSNAIVSDDAQNSEEVNAFSGNDLTVTLPTDLESDWLVQASSISVRYGSFLYEDYDGCAAADGASSIAKYVTVKADELVTITLSDLSGMYNEYYSLANEGKQSYVSDDDLLTLEIYIWPFHRSEAGRVVALTAAEFGAENGKYLIGTSHRPDTYENGQFRVNVSAYAGANGSGSSGSRSCYVKMSFHISPLKQ